MQSALRGRFKYIPPRGTIKEDAVRLRITLVSVIIVIISAFGHTSFAFESPAQDPRPTKSCPYEGAIYKAGGTTNINARIRAKVDYKNDGTIGIVSWKPKPGYRICRVVVYDERGRRVFPHQSRKVKPRGDRIEWFNESGRQYGKIGDVWVFTKRK